MDDDKNVGAEDDMDDKSYDEADDTGYDDDMKGWVYRYEWSEYSSEHIVIMDNERSTTHNKNILIYR